MIRVYVASLADYNAGTLHGSWVELGIGVDADDVRLAVQRMMLDQSKQVPAEEYAIHDHEGFGDYRVDEHHDLDELCTVAVAIDTHGPEVVTHALRESDADQLGEWIQDHYLGSFDSPGGYAENLYHETGMLKAVPDAIRHHINWESVARDMGFDGYHFEQTAHDTCLVFSP